MVKTQMKSGSLLFAKVLVSIFSEYKGLTKSMVLFDLMLYIPVNNFSVMSGQVYLG